MSETENIIGLFMEFSGADKMTAERILKENNYDLNHALDAFLESDFVQPGLPGCSRGSNSNSSSGSGISSNSDPANGRAAATATASSAAIPSSIVYPNTAVSEAATLPDDDDDEDDDENIRAPIPPKREQLLLPEDDNFRYRKRRAPVFTVCPLRNFAREAEMQEQQLSWYMENKEKHRNSPHARPKRSRLDDLFCPPIDLLFWGSFRAAREHATAQNRWLIVNLQDNSEFKSQILNRDIWPDPELKDLILKYFVLWQVSVDNAEGWRFKAFYRVENMPYVCIIDPRTGEEKLSCDVVTPQTFRTELKQFLDVNLFSLEPEKGTMLNPYLHSPSTSKTSASYSSSSSRHRTSTVTKSCSSVVTSAASSVSQSSMQSSSSTSSLSTLTSSLTSTSTAGGLGEPPAPLAPISPTTSRARNSTSTTSNNENSDLKPKYWAKLDMPDLSEEEQIALAIINSLKETQSPATVVDENPATVAPVVNATTAGRGNSNVGTTEPDDATTLDDYPEVLAAFENENEAAAAVTAPPRDTYQKYLGNQNDPQTKIQLRLPAGERIQLEWPKSTKLRAIRLFINSKYPDIAKDTYKLITAFPRQNILELDETISLEDAKLHPTAMLHLHPDD